MFLLLYHVSTSKIKTSEISPNGNSLRTITHVYADEVVWLHHVHETFQGRLSHTNPSVVMAAGSLCETKKNDIVFNFSSLLARKSQRCLLIKFFVSVCHLKTVVLANMGKRINEVNTLKMKKYFCFLFLRESLTITDVTSLYRRVISCMQSWCHGMLF